MSAEPEFSIKAEALEDIVALVFVACGLEPAVAEIVAVDLVAADLDGVPSHGVALVPLYVDRLKAGSVSLAAAGSILRDDGSTILIDAHNALGQVTARQAVDLVTARAAVHGLAAVAVRNAFHLGAAGLYARRIAAAGAIGIVMSNTRPLMPPTGGAEPLVGNNPIAIAAPSADGSVSVDAALSASAMGKVRLAAAAGDTIPEGWAVDRAGAPTTDPAAAIAGMLLPAAGPKGFGLAFLVDLMCGGLSGGGVGPAVTPLFGDMSVPYNCSQFFLAIDVGRFGDAEAFRATASAAAARVVAARRAPGVERIYAPGERAQARRVAAGGRCRLSASTREALVAAGGRAGVDLVGRF